jgi:hypothetical protein
MYTHLNQSNSQLQVGFSFEKGEPLTGMVVGSFTDDCGYADQNPANWHVHFGFPDYGTWPFEAYTLSTADGVFYGWDGNYETGDIITAEWDVPNPPGPPGPPGGSGGTSIWDFLVEGLVTVAASIVSILGDHQAINLATNILVFASIPLELFFWMTLTYFNMTWIITVFIIILVGEGIKLLITIWFGIKKIIPGLST